MEARKDVGFWPVSVLSVKRVIVRGDDLMNE
jgi:hypothetical protein